MIDTMHVHNGAGLAAIQVGRDIAIFVIAAGVAGRAETDDPVVFVDPEVIDLSKEKRMEEEGCLSIPDIHTPVKRPYRCKMRAYDRHGVQFEVESAELYGRAMQHEYDHLLGKLIMDRIGPIKRTLIEKKMKQYHADRQ